MKARRLHPPSGPRPGPSPRRRAAPRRRPRPSCAPPSARARPSVKHSACRRSRSGNASTAWAVLAVAMPRATRPENSPSPPQHHHPHPAAPRRPPATPETRRRRRPCLGAFLRLTLGRPCGPGLPSRPRGRRGFRGVLASASLAWHLGLRLLAFWQPQRRSAESASEGGRVYGA